MTTETSRTEYVVVMEPEYFPYQATEGVKASLRRTVTISEDNYLEAAQAAVAAFTGKRPKTLRSEGRRYRDAESICRFVTRRDRDGNRFMLIVDTSPAEKARVEAKKAAEAAAHQSMVDAAKPDQEEWQRLSALHPGIRASLSRGYVRVEWKAEFGVEGESNHDYCRIEIKKDGIGWGSDEDTWDPAEVSVGNGTMKRPAAHAAVLVLAIESAVAVAEMLDATYTSGVPAIPKGDNQIAANYRAHTALLTRVVEVLRQAEVRYGAMPVSYTHLTLPTNREV